MPFNGEAPSSPFTLPRKRLERHKNTPRKFEIAFVIGCSWEYESGVDPGILSQRCRADCAKQRAKARL